MRDTIGELSKLAEDKELSKLKLLGKGKELAIGVVVGAGEDGMNFSSMTLGVRFVGCDCNEDRVAVGTGDSIGITFELIIVEVGSGDSDTAGGPHASSPLQSFVSQLANPTANSSEYNGNELPVAIHTKGDADVAVARVLVAKIADQGGRGEAFRGGAHVAPGERRTAACVRAVVRVSVRFRS